MKDIHNYSLFRKGLVLLIFILPIISIVSLIFILCNDKLVFEPSSNGFNNILDYFKFPISLMAAFLAALTINFTIKRINQTDNQINILADNNRFNNYYKLNEEFIKYFDGQELLSLYKKTFPNNSVFEINNHLQRLFKYFYGDNSKYFTTKILSKELNKINNYLLVIDDNVFNKSDWELTTIDYSVLSNISDYNLEIIKSFIKPLSEKLVAPIYSNRNLSVPNLKEIDKHYLLMNELFLSVSIYESLLLFDGEKVNNYSKLRNNFMNYLEKIGLK